MSMKMSKKAGSLAGLTAATAFGLSVALSPPVAVATITAVRSGRVARRMPSRFPPAPPVQSAACPWHR